MTESIVRQRNAVLVVDDDIDALIEMSEALREHGLNVCTASDGAEAIWLAQQFKPEFVLMDCQMPLISGLKASLAIRRILPDVQVILITGFDKIHQVVSKKGTDTVAILKKPLSINTIGRFICNSLEQRKRKRKMLLGVGD